MVVVALVVLGGGGCAGSGCGCVEGGSWQRIDLSHFGAAFHARNADSSVCCCRAELLISQV